MNSALLCLSGREKAPWTPGVESAHTVLLIGMEQKTKSVSRVPGRMTGFLEYGLGEGGAAFVRQFLVTMVWGSS